MTEPSAHDRAQTLVNPASQRAVPQRPRGLFVGLCTLDIVHRVDRLPDDDEKVTALGQEIGAGGPAAGAALTFAALGGAATLVTAIGRHPIGEVVRVDLAAGGVDVVDASDSDAAPAVSTARVHAVTGHRSVSSIDAANTDIEPPADFAALAGAADVVLYDGHHPRLGAAVAQWAAATDVPLVIDAGRWRPVFAAVLPAADFVVASAAFTVEGRHPTARDLLSTRTAAAAVTRGDQPIEWATVLDAGAVEVGAVEGGNTLGAGDAFHGAVAFAVGAVGRSMALPGWRDVLQFAADVAAVRVSSIDPRGWLHDRRLEGKASRWTA